MTIVTKTINGASDSDLWSPTQAGEKGLNNHQTQDVNSAACITLWRADGRDLNALEGAEGSRGPQDKLLSSLTHDFHKDSEAWAMLPCGCSSEEYF
ncbi:hypothetical protein PoB_000560400 [Plakobranchus ocellatus]|uniref:Uncharacterized protein n=1 Tax=Plakobranchus ocellatus TaxID=259542 RepID=A0AAV3Y9Z2_9GAST|nr:hypothetical protein PoB_000560400 [Plakobranchus ocellatus]